MTPQLYQAIRIMAMPVQELRTTIQQELEQNPALEVVEDRATSSLESLTAEERVGQDGDEAVFATTSDPGYSGARGAGDDDAKRRFLEGALARPESLQEHLLWQLRLEPIDAAEFELGELLIRNLDEHGFHREAPELLKPEVPAARQRKVVELVQSLDPVGTCTANVTESLLAQIRLHPAAPPHAAELVAQHLPLAQRGKLAELARVLSTDEEAVRELLSFVGTLEPYPGRNFSAEPPRYVLPDVTVRTIDGELRLILNDHYLPILGISDYFEELGDSAAEGAAGGTDGGAAPEPGAAGERQKELQRFVKQNVQGARWFIRSIDERNKSLLKVARAIVEFQRAFFRGGPKRLVPLTLKDVAEQVGVHEATVSRLANGKYMQTEFGIFELRYFFTNSISGAGSKGSRFSKIGVKEMVREIIEGDRSGSANGRPLSDSKIAERLAESGVSIARRTVAKYRKELDIDSSFERRAATAAGG